MVKWLNDCNRLHVGFRLTSSATNKKTKWHAAAGKVIGPTAPHYIYPPEDNPNTMYSVHDLSTSLSSNLMSYGLTECNITFLLCHHRLGVWSHVQRSCNFRPAEVCSYSLKVTKYVHSLRKWIFQTTFEKHVITLSIRMTRSSSQEEEREKGVIKWIKAQTLNVYHVLHD